MKGKIPFVEIAIGDTDIWGVGAEAANGTFTKLWDAHNPNNTPEEKAFADAYLKKHGKPPADKAWMGWITARSLFESIDAAKSTERRQDHRGARSLEGAGRQRVLQLPQVRSPDAGAQPRGLGEGQDHRQVGLLRRQGDAAGEPGRPRQGVRHARRKSAARWAAGRACGAAPTMLDILLSQTGKRPRARRPLRADRDRAVDHLRPARHREFRPRRVLHAGRLLRADAGAAVRLAGGDPLRRSSSAASACWPSGC